MSERSSRRLDRLGATTPASSGYSEAWARMMEVLETLKDLILEHADEIDRDYRERVAAGQDHRGALIAAKRAAWGCTAEGRAALAVADALEERRGRGDT